MNIRSRRNCSPCPMSGKPPANGEYVIATKGAPEAIADLCHFDAEQTAANWSAVSTPWRRTACAFLPWPKRVFQQRVAGEST